MLEIGAVDLSVIHDLVHHFAGKVYGNCKSDAFVSTRSVRHDGCVDTDEFTAIIHKRAAGNCPD